MTITRSNWLELLKDDILARQTLYPDGGDVGLLHGANWLKKLRNDQLANQRLYPSADSGHVGLLTKTNFLLIFREDIMERGTLWPEGGLSGLKSAINRAIDIMTNTEISIDGTDIPTNKWWTTQSIRDVFNSTINTAQTVSGDPTASDEDWDETLISLNAAISLFNSLRQRGTLSTTGPVWEITYSQPSQVTMNRIIIPLSSFTGYQPQMVADMNDTTHGVYDLSFVPTGRVKLSAKYVLSPADDWMEISLDDVVSQRPFNRLTRWEWETPNIRITGDNSTGQPISIKLVMS